MGCVILFKSWALIQRYLGLWKSPSMRAPTVVGVSRGAPLQAVGFRSLGLKCQKLVEILKLQDLLCCFIFGASMTAGMHCEPSYTVVFGNSP